MNTPANTARAASVFDHPAYDAHEQVVYHADPASGLRAIIAVHDTTLGPALGGCRMVDYVSEAAALDDVLRLARAMSYKAALADVPQGGGKSVILGDPRRDKTPALLRAMGRFIDRLGGRYIVAEDSGTGVDDMREMARETAHVSGVADAAAAAAGAVGDPSPATARGVFIALQATVRAALGRDDLRGLRVAIQGVGNVGHRLAGHLHAAGAQLWVADTFATAVDGCVAQFGATPVGVDEIHALDVDVYAPCALGGAISATTLPALRAAAVVGGANNQLADPAVGEVLRSRGILYAPDYIANAGGIIDIHHQRHGYDAARVEAHLRRIGTTLDAVFARARDEGRATGDVADDEARRRLGRAA